MKRILTLIFLTVLLMPMMAQKIGVEGFKKVKKDLLNQTPLPVDKKQATLDFLTDEKGFTFKANGTVDVQAEEGDGKIRRSSCSLSTPTTDSIRGRCRARA